MATSPQHWRPLSHSIWCPSRPVTRVRARDSDSTSTLSYDGAGTEGDSRPRPPCHAREAHSCCVPISCGVASARGHVHAAARLLSDKQTYTHLHGAPGPAAGNACPAVDRGAGCAGADAATEEALAQQCHRFRLSVDVHSVQARRLPTSLASVYATATLPPDLPGCATLPCADHATEITIVAVAQNSLPSASSAMHLTKLS